MSLSQLLAVGKSIEGGRNTPNPFRINHDKGLPKFAPVGRPISLAPPPKPFTETVELFYTARKARQPIPAPPMQRTAPVVAPAVTINARPARKRLFLLNPFANKSIASRPPVQTELSLDTLRVVRNELRDADLELVPAQPAEPVAPITAGPEVLKRKAVVTVWNRLIKKLHGLRQAWH